VVCSNHFKPEDYKKSINGLVRRKKDAVPSVFEWNSEVKKRKSPRKRQSFLTTEPVIELESAVEVSTSVNTSAFDAAAVAKLNSTLPEHDYVCNVPTIEEKLESAVQEIERLQNVNKSLRKERFCIERYSGSPEVLKFYTGFSNYQTLTNVFNTIAPTASTMITWSQYLRKTLRNVVSEFRDTSNATALSLIGQFFLVLTRLRTGMLELELADRFNISQTTVSRTLITWLNYLYFYLGSIPIWPSRSGIDKHMPEIFKPDFVRTRVIIDCTELYVQKPASLCLNSELYSNYKSNNTFKGLVGSTPAGALSFVSALYSGSISDKETTKQCGIIELLEPGDGVMADKGFVINELLQPSMCSLIIPPFLSSNGQFTRDEVVATKSIANRRVHIERAIRRVKEFHIFDRTIPLNLAGCANQIWTVCCLLTNFSGPLFHH
jgi:hypothetical protein